MNQKTFDLLTRKTPDKLDVPGTPYKARILRSSQHTAIVRFYDRDGDNVAMVTIPVDWEDDTDADILASGYAEWRAYA